MVGLDRVDLDMLVTALQDRSQQLRWFFDRGTGHVELLLEESALDDDPDSRDDLFSIDPIPPHEWYETRHDFADGVSDSGARTDLLHALEGKKPFRRFGDALYDRHRDLVDGWRVYERVSAQRAAVRWLRDADLVDVGEADAYLAAHEVPEIP